MTTERWCNDCGNCEPHRQIGDEGDYGDDAFQCLLCLILNEPETAANGGPDR